MVSNKKGKSIFFMILAISLIILLILEVAEYIENKKLTSQWAQSITNRYFVQAKEVMEMDQQGSIQGCFDFNGNWITTGQFTESDIRLRCRNGASQRRKLAGDVVVEIIEASYSVDKGSIQDGLKCPNDVSSCYQAPSLEILSGTNGDGYRGYQSQTKSGKTCQNWDRIWPHIHTLGNSNCDIDESSNGQKYYQCDESKYGLLDVEYRGCQSQTQSGKTCLAWDQLTPALQADKVLASKGTTGTHNFCRNPDTEPTIWCYIDEGDPNFELCNPLELGLCKSDSECKGARTCSSSTGIGQCQGAHNCPASDTWTTRGLGSHNYCRNPGNSKSTIYCYTNDLATEFEECDPLITTSSEQTIARLDNLVFSSNEIGSAETLSQEDCRQKCYDQGFECDETLTGTQNSDYRGCQTKTQSGYTCQAWDQQFPNINDYQSNRCDWDESYNIGGSGKCSYYANECGWRKVRHLEAGASSWFTVPNQDGLTGAEVWGDENNDSNSWGVQFDNFAYDQILIQTNDKSDWAVFEKTDILGSVHEGAEIQPISSSRPNVSKYTDDGLYKCDNSNFISDAGALSLAACRNRCQSTSSCLFFNIIPNSECRLFSGACISQPNPAANQKKYTLTSLPFMPFLVWNRDKTQYQTDPIIQWKNGEKEFVVDDPVETDILNKYSISGSKCLWNKVRFVPQGTTWHPVNDNLKGSAANYGDPTSNAAAWGIKFDDIKFKYFLFMTEDQSKWLIAEKDEVSGSFYSNSDRKILKSSESESETTAKWYNRELTPEDPWISTKDHDQNLDSILYGENGLNLNDINLGVGGGNSVYISDCGPDYDTLLSHNNADNLELMTASKKGVGIWVRQKSKSPDNCARPMDDDFKTYECKGERTCSKAGNCIGTDGCPGSDKWETKGLGIHNYCRNPNLEKPTIWCFTTQSGTISEECDAITACQSYWWQTNQCKMFTSEYNPASLPSTASASSYIDFWLNKDNYDKLDYELPSYNQSPTGAVGATNTYQIVTTTSTLDSITVDTNFNAPILKNGKYITTPKVLWFDQLQFKIYVYSGFVKFLSDIKTLNSCSGTFSKILDGTSYMEIVQTPAVITSTITETTFIKNVGTCDDSISCDFLTAKVAYEKEFYFFDKFTVPNGKCGQLLTYTLKDSPSGTETSSTVAEIDEVALVPGKMRIYLKSAAVQGSQSFTVTASNIFGATVDSQIITIQIKEMIFEDYYQEYIDLWISELAAAVTYQVSLDQQKLDAEALFTTKFDLREQLMPKADDLVVGKPMKDLYDDWKAEYTSDPNSLTTAAKYNSYRAKENEYLADNAFPSSYKTKIRDYYAAEAALKLAIDAQTAGTVRQQTATTEKGKVEDLMEIWCNQGFSQKILLPTDSLKEVEYDDTNAMILIGDITKYFEKIYYKNNCKIKECSIVQADTLMPDAVNSANFQDFDCPPPPIPTPTITLIQSDWSCMNKGTQSGPSQFGITLDQCDTICQSEPLCVWIQYTPQYQLCARMKDDCELLASSRPGENSYRPTGYLPTYECNCPPSLVTTSTTLVQNNWSCGDGGSLSSGSDAWGITLDECDKLCRLEPLCVWIQFNPTNGRCERRKDGCEATAGVNNAKNVYRPTGYVPKGQCNWQILKLDIPEGIEYPTYNMKCVIDINKDGYNPKTKDIYGLDVNLVQVMDCTKAITTLKSDHMWPFKSSTQLLEVGISDFTTIGGQGLLGTKEHCGPTECQVTSSLSATCEQVVPSSLLYESTGVLENMIIKVKTASETYWQANPPIQETVTAGGGLCIRCVNKLAGYVYANKLTMKKDKATKCYTSLTPKDFTIALTGATPFEYGWRGYDKDIATKTDLEIDVWPGPPKQQTDKVTEEVLTWPFVINSEETDCQLFECQVFDLDCKTANTNSDKISIETTSPWKVQVQRDFSIGYQTPLCIQCTNKLLGDEHVQQTMDWIFTYTMYGICSQTLNDKIPPKTFLIDYNSADVFADFKIPLDIEQFQSENTKNNECSINTCELFPEYRILELVTSVVCDQNVIALEYISKTTFSLDPHPLIAPDKPDISPYVDYVNYESEKQKLDYYHDENIALQNIFVNNILQEPTKPFNIKFKPTIKTGYKLKLKYKCKGSTILNPDYTALNYVEQEYVISIKQNPECSTSQYRDANFVDGFQSTIFWHEYKSTGISEDWKVGITSTSTEFDHRKLIKNFDEGDKIKQMFIVNDVETISEKYQCSEFGTTQAECEGDDTLFNNQYILEKNVNTNDCSFVGGKCTNLRQQCGKNTCELFDEDCTAANPYSDKITLVTEPYFYIKGKMQTPEGYSHTVCLKCSNEQGGSHTRLLEFTQRRDCNLVLSPLNEPKTVIVEFLQSPIFPCPYGTCVTSTEDSFNWIKTLGQKTSGTAILIKTGVQTYQDCLNQCDNIYNCEAANYKGTQCELYKDTFVSVIDPSNQLYQRVSGIQYCEWKAKIDKPCESACFLKDIYKNNVDPLLDYSHLVMYCEKFTSSSICDNDMNGDSYRKLQDFTLVTDINGEDQKVYNDFSWESLFTNSDTLTCPTLECKFTDLATNNVIDKETDIVQVLKDQFNIYGKTNEPGGWNFERSVLCQTQDAFLDKSITPYAYTKLWPFKFIIKQERNCLRYLKPKLDIFTSPISKTSQTWSAVFYPSLSDPLYDPTFLPEPLDFTKLKYVNYQSRILVDVLHIFEEEPFPGDKQCQFTSCQVFENGCINPIVSEHLKIFDSPIKIQINTNYDDGFDKIFCAKCWIRHMEFVSKEFRIVQRANCAISLRSLDIATVYPLYHLHFEDTNDSNRAQNGKIDWRLLFKNMDENYCGVTKCDIFSDDCKLQQAGSHLQIQTTYPNFQIIADQNVNDGYEESACIKCINPLQTYETNIKIIQRVGCKAALGYLPMKDVATPYMTTSDMIQISNGFTDFYSNARPAECGFTKCSLYHNGCKIPFTQSQFIKIQTDSPWKVSMIQNISEGFGYTLCYSCTNDKQILGVKWRVDQHYDCKIKMKAIMIMDSTSSGTQNYNIFTYNVVAGNPIWHLNFFTEFKTPFCPTSLSGMKILINGVPPKNQTYFDFTQNTDKLMAGKFITQNKIGSHEQSSQHNMTIDLFDENNPYLEIRAAVILFNVIEINKTNPVFATPLDLNQKVAQGRDLDIVLPKIDQFSQDAEDPLEMKLIFKSDVTQNAIVFDKLTNKIKVSAHNNLQIGIHTFQIQLLEIHTGLFTNYDFSFTVLEYGSKMKDDGFDQPSNEIVPETSQQLNETGSNFTSSNSTTTQGMNDYLTAENKTFEVIEQKPYIPDYVANLSTRSNFTWYPKIITKKSKENHLPVILKLNKITRSGLVEIGFNQKLKVPIKFTKKRMLAKDDIFLIQIKNSDGERTDYQHQIISWSADTVELQIDFENPLEISQNILHQFKIVINQLDMFVSEDTGEPLKQIGLEQMHFVQVLKRQLPKDVSETTLSVIAHSQSIIFLAIIIIQLFIAFLLNGEMVYFWTFLSMLQIVVYMPIIKVNFPPNAEIFLELMRHVAEFELFDTHSLIGAFGNIFGIDQYETLDPNQQEYQNAGFRDFHFWSNMEFIFYMSSLFLFGLLIILILSLFPCFKIQLQKFIFKLKKKWIWDNLLRLINVIYLYTIIAYAIACKINNMSFIISVGVILSLYPIWTLYFLLKNREQLVNRNILEKYWSLYGGLRYKQIQSLFYPFISAARKIIFVGGAIVLTEWSYFQVQLFTFLNILYSIYFAGSHPKVRIWDYRIELYNEWAIQIMSFHLMCFTDMVMLDTEPLINYKLGESFKYFALFTIFLNLALVSHGMIHPVRHFIRKERFRRMVPELIAARIKEREENTKQKNRDLKANIKVILKGYKHELKKNQLQEELQEAAANQLPTSQNEKVKVLKTNEIQKKSFEFKKQFYLEIQAKQRKVELEKMRNLNEESEQIRKKVIQDRKKEKAIVDNENLISSSSSDDEDIQETARPKLKHIFRHQFFPGELQSNIKMPSIKEQNWEETIKSERMKSDRKVLSQSQKSYLNLKSKSGLTSDPRKNNIIISNLKSKNLIKK